MLTNYFHILRHISTFYDINIFFPVIDLKQIEETRDKSMEEGNEVIHSDKENETNQIMVLPTCDNLGESTQLARNNKSFIDTSSMDLEKGTATNLNLLTFGIPTYCTLLRHKTYVFFHSKFLNIF